ncbi:MAG TPA: hypothetical protein VH062_07490 [Polyangiaceae bacterium]|nr:hypothetical protein [Polyangiaceae bacterium]
MSRIESVELVDSERVVPYGDARVTWLVRKGDGWVRATQWPGATTAARDAGPGTVWERAVTLALVAGTELVRVESRPRIEAPKDPLSYLDRRGARPRTTRRTLYRVEVGGRVRALSDARSRQ